MAGQQATLPTQEDMAALIDLDRYPLAALDGPRCRDLIAAAQAGLAQEGSFTFEGFLRPEALLAAVAEVEPMVRTESYHHAQQHNIYFDNSPLPEAAAGLGARALTTSNRALTGDQLKGSVIQRVYRWDPLRHFLAKVMKKPALYRMADPLAQLNVMGYGPGDQIAWHFDRAEFTVTLPLQAPREGGQFRYSHNLRSAEDPNYAGVRDLLAGHLEGIKSLPVPPGSLNVFAGFRSPHCVTPIAGDRMRLIAVLSFMEKPDVQFSAKDRIQFYGRSESRAANGS